MRVTSCWGSRGQIDIEGDLARKNKHTYVATNQKAHLSRAAEQKVHSRRIPFWVLGNAQIFGFGDLRGGLSCKGVGEKVLAN